MLQPEPWQPDPEELTHDADTFTVIYRQHADAVYAYIRARVAQDADAQDITAQTFVAALRAIKRFDPARSSIRTWLIGIARHKLADHWRKHPAKVGLDAVKQAANPGPSVDELVGLRLDMAAVRAALAQLPADRAEVIQLRLLGGLSTAETAKSMGRSEGAIKMLLLRALKDLRRLLGVQDADPGSKSND